MRNIILASAILLITIACDHSESGGSSSSAALRPDRYQGSTQPVGSIPSTGPVPSGCVRTEGTSLGTNVTLDVGGRTVQFTSWTSKDGESNGEYVAFSFTASGPVAYAVKAGRETYWGTTNSWTHPAGLSGSSAHAISNVTFCGVPGGETGAGGADAGTPDSGDCVDVEGSCGPPSGSEPTGERGDTCTQDSCYSGQCVENYCEGGASGDRCRSSNDCKAGHYCDVEQHTCYLDVGVN